jgi:hypothetical protein
MRKAVFCMLILSLGCAARAQESAPVHFIRGNLSDAEAQLPVPYATVSISNTTIGTAADGNGGFVLRIDEPYKRERMVVSCIGYLTQTYSIDSLLRVQGSHTFPLRPDNPLLSEILVKEARVSASDLVKEAARAVEKNYFQKPFNLELYSVINANDSVTGKSFTVETILSGYYEGYRSGANRKFEIKEKRATGEDPLQTVGYPYWPSFEILSADLLTDPAKRGIFNLDRHDEFVFKLTGIQTLGSDTVFHIDYYAPKPNARITGYGTVPKTYRGSIFITTSTFAVVRHEIVTSSFAYHIIYRKVGDHYFPYFISGTRLNEFKLGGGKREFKTHNALTVTDIRLHDAKVIGEKANGVNVHMVKYNESFWNKYYPRN